MSRHIGRKQRWSQLDARRYGSALGQVFYEQNGWYAVLDYKTLAPPEPDNSTPTWIGHQRRLGPFKRPRNAMVALEREVTALRNHHGKDLLVGGQLWAET